MCESIQLSQNELEIFYNSVNLVRTAKKVWALKKKYGQNFSYLQLASSWNILSQKVIEHKSCGKLSLLMYRKVANSSTSHLVAHRRIFRLFTKVKLKAYLLWAFREMLFFALVPWSQLYGNPQCAHLYRHRVGRLNVYEMQENICRIISPSFIYPNKMLIKIVLKSTRNSKTLNCPTSPNQPNLRILFHKKESTPGLH